MFMFFMLATVKNFSIKTIRIWHSFHGLCFSNGVLCKILVFVVKITDAIKPTKKKKEEKKKRERSKDFELRNVVLFNINSALYA